MKKYLILIFLGVFMVGCAEKEPSIKELYIPVKCPLKMPLKPQNNGDFQSHKEMMIYYLECENIALQCVGEK